MDDPRDSKVPLRSEQHLDKTDRVAQTLERRP